MLLPENNTYRSFEDIRHDLTIALQGLLNRIYNAHDAIAGLTYDGKHTPSWVVPNLEKVAAFRAEAATLEKSDLMQAYFLKAPDSGLKGRENSNTLHEALNNYEAQVRKAKGSGDDSDYLRPTGGGLARRTTPNELVTVRDEIRHSDQSSYGTRNGPFNRPIGGDGSYHAVVRRTHDNTGRTTSTEIYYKDILGNSLRKR